MLAWAGRAPPAGQVPAPTSGADFLTGDKIVAGQHATLAVWDLDGSAGPGEGLGSQCCALAQAAVLVYDPARPDAAASLARWVAHLPPGLPRVVLASCRPEAGAGGAEGEEREARRSATIAAVLERCRASQTPHFLATSLADEASIQAAFGEAARLGLRRCVESRKQQEGGLPHLPSLSRELPGAMQALLAQRCAAC